MRMTRLTSFCGLVAITAASVASSAHAAFIVEADNVAPAGKANANFSSTGHTLSTTPSTAVGLSGNQSATGGNPANSTGPDEYTLRYTPGVDIENTVFVPGTVLGTHRLDPAASLVAEQQLATGLVGGLPGLYNVFVTWPASGNVATAGSKITITNDGAPVVLDPVTMNTTTPNGPTPIGLAGANKWLKIGQVELSPLTQYTVKMLANNPSFTPQRIHGVMWEYVGPVIPEPSTLTLGLVSGLGCLGIARRRTA